MMMLNAETKRDQEEDYLFITSLPRLIPSITIPITSKNCGDPKFFKCVYSKISTTF